MKPPELKDLMFVLAEILRQNDVRLDQIKNRPKILDEKSVVFVDGICWDRELGLLCLTGYLVPSGLREKAQISDDELNAYMIPSLELKIELVPGKGHCFTKFMGAARR